MPCRTLIFSIISVFSILKCHAQMFEERFSLDWVISQKDPYRFTVEEKLYFENGVSRFLNNAMTKSLGFIHQENFLVKFLHIKDQLIDVSKKELFLRAEIAVLYAGMENENFLDSLSTLVTRDKADEFLEQLKKQGFLVDWKSKTSKIEFEPAYSLPLVGDDDVTPEDYEALFVITIVLAATVMILSAAILLAFAVLHLSNESKLPVDGKNQDCEIGDILEIKKTGTMETSPGSAEVSPANSFGSHSEDSTRNKKSCDHILDRIHILNNCPNTPPNFEHTPKSFTSSNSSKTLRRRFKPVVKPISFDTP